MKLYFAGSDSNMSRKILKEGKVERVLFSYFYSKSSSIDVFQKDFKDIFIDSGGYSARIQGVNISVKDYAEYVKRCLSDKDSDVNIVYANLDQKETKDTLVNQEYLESQGLKPIPVYHASEFFSDDKKILFDYIKKHNYIAVGGMAGSGFSREKIGQYLDFVFKYTREKVKVHGFGILSLEMLKCYPFYSVDATSWLQSTRFGLVTEFKNGEKVNHKRDGRTILSMKISRKDEDLVNKQIKEYIKLEDFITRLWEAKGVKWTS